MKTHRSASVVCAALGGLALLGASGCSSGGTTDNSAAEIATREALPPAVKTALTRSTPVDPALVSANTKFGLAVFQEVRKADADKNVFLSPTSLALALQIVYNGAADTTRNAMAETLNVKGVSLAQLNAGNAALQASLTNPDPKVELTIANALWKRGAAMKPEFLQTNTEFYGSELGELSVGADAINAWVAKKTKDKIKKIVPEGFPDADTVAILVNTVYFKGAWTDKFDPAQTTAAQFTKADGTKVSVRMMHQNGTYDYYKGTNFQAVRLPYGKKRLSMLFFLPDATVTLNTFLNDLTAAKWDEWLPKFQSKAGIIAVPRFKSEYGVALKTALSALGMEIAFDSTRADFAALNNTNENFYLQFVQHNTFVEVTEEGTEAAGATGIGVGTTSAPVPFTLTFDRPFFCAIRDDKTGTILFLGQIQNPAGS